MGLLSEPTILPQINLYSRRSRWTGQERSSSSLSWIAILTPERGLNMRVGSPQLHMASSSCSDLATSAFSSLANRLSKFLDILLLTCEDYRRWSRTEFLYDGSNKSQLSIRIHGSSCLQGLQYSCCASKKIASISIHPFRTPQFLWSREFRRSERYFGLHGQQLTAEFSSTLPEF